jgi:hypothetical protein
MSTTHSHSPHSAGEEQDSGAAPRAEGTGPSAGTGPVHRAQLKNLTVRELLSQLTKVEDELRSTPFWIDDEEGRRVNTEVAELLALQRAIAEQLRARRLSWTSDGAGRQQSASWPAPPWT